MILLRTESMGSAGGGGLDWSWSRPSCPLQRLGVGQPYQPPVRSGSLQDPPVVTQGLELVGGATERASGFSSGMFVYCLLFTFVC